ncbi:MAG: hypothetical protein P8X42_05280 [Calditrichaceae bacterium]
MNRLITFIKENYVPLLVAFGLALRLGENKVLVNKVPDKVILEVSGKGRALIGLMFYNLKINLELPEVNKSTVINLNNYINRFDVAPELGVDIVDIIEPKQLDLRVDRLMTEKKPVRLKADIKTAPGYTLNKYTLGQDSVIVSGPAMLVERLNYLETEKVTKNDVKYPFQENVKLVQPREGIIQLEPDYVIVSFDIEQIVERTIYEIPIQIVGVPPSLTASASPKNVSLRIKGSESIITNITKDEITVFFDYSRDYQKGKSEYEYQIETPDNVTWTSAIPRQFRLHLQRVGTD